MKRFFYYLCIVAFSLFLATCNSVTSTSTTSSETIDSVKEQVYYFSVSDTSTVMFAYGNLQYNIETGTYQFAEHQYDYIGKNNENMHNSYYKGCIDLFGFGTGDNPTLNSREQQDYAHFVDWGTKVDDGHWRTLTKEEWSYLFFTRSNAEKLVAYGTINGISGIFLLPDNFLLPEGLSFVPSIEKGLKIHTDRDYPSYVCYYNENGKNYSHNTYSLTDWEKMETAGAVFLPAAGYYSNVALSILVSGSQSKGFYWSSTIGSHRVYNGQHFYDAYHVMFSESNLNPMDVWGLEAGHSVRLVRNL